ncbi:MULTISPECIES: alpha/beta fold hydrolase [Shewanella]|uniref:Alpha/beta fold hydrolase n=2 Tax=Unclassified Bacteria TaxID=49928 RepID=A0AAU6VVW8_UNCXX|nr:MULTISPECIES: alpha/beta fold hydrolase [Shewanella]MBO2653920.1 alpha/beta fold hydrolase [Shewanella algae]MCT8979267.1 alpha/beta fold hydrolase [Shewanella algae]MDC8853990.1 alpha/beta fold hydrolase [Shewanella algae]MDE0567498.1 alpha/beta fold hydrolase [Shewanella sp. K8]NJI84870.1 alpha/beta fold hydrolase [Shewanella sp. Iso12]
MHFVSTGSGSPALLIHGLFGDLDNLKSLGALLEQNHRVIRIDCPNHGQSEHWPQMDYPGLAKALVSLLDELAIGKVHLVGHSMGGKIAMATALAYPQRVQSLTAADIAPVAYTPRHEKVFAGLNSMPLDIKDRRQALAHLLNHEIDEATAQFLLKSLRRSESGFEWKMNLPGLIESYPAIIGWHNGPERCGGQLSYQGPTLMIRGSESNYVTAAYKEEIVAQFPKVKAKTLEGCGHWLHAQKPAIFNRIVSDFIDSND